MIITISNQRGGVAKSTTCLNVGACLHRMGKSVLLVDLDAQCNLTSTLSDESGKTVLDALKEPDTIKDCIRQTEEGDLLAGSQSLAVLDRIFEGDKKELRLKNALDKIRSDYDFVIVDTPPSLSLVTVSAFIASDGVIIPTQADPYSFQGIKQLMQTVETIREHVNHTLKIMGIVVTRYNQRTTIRRKLVSLLQQAANSIQIHLYSSTIREATAIVESSTARKSLFNYAPKSGVTMDYKNLVNEILTQL